MDKKQFSELRINGQRLWDSLMTMAEIGATKKGGCNRQALTDEDKQGRDLFVKWCIDAGCSIKVDKMGNIFARREGKNNDLASRIPPNIRAYNVGGSNASWLSSTVATFSTSANYNQYGLSGGLDTFGSVIIQLFF